jgi:hypothetical protein
MTSGFPSSAPRLKSLRLRNRENNITVKHCNNKTKQSKTKHNKNTFILRLSTRKTKTTVTHKTRYWQEDLLLLLLKKKKVKDAASL